MINLLRQLDKKFDEIFEVDETAALAIVVLIAIVVTLAIFIVIYLLCFYAPLVIMSIPFMCLLGLVYLAVRGYRRAK